MRAAESTEPLSDGDLEALLAPVAGAGTIALAVSGGADSLALLDGVDRWRRRDGRPRVVVLTVDHGLRPASSGEAGSVVAAAAARGLPARCLTLSGPRPTSDIEAAARAARYRLLLGAVRDLGASHLLLAHHRDDQAETFLMRLQRGSGVFGLAAMRRSVESDGVVIFRPFLDVPRSRLVANTAAAGLVPVDDPMNRDTRFLRVRVRQALPALAAAGITPDDLAATAARFAAAADAIDAATDRFIVAAVTVDDFAIVRIRAADFRGEPEEIRLRLLVRVLMAIGGESYPPRFERLKALHDGLWRTDDGRFKRTLAGVVAEIQGDSLVFYRESGRAGLPTAAVAPGHSGVWDHRFSVEIGADAPTDLMLGPLGEAGLRAFPDRPRHVPAAALAVQPALWRGGELLCAPTLAPTELSVGDGARRVAIRVRQIVRERLAVAPRFPRFADS